MLIDIIAGARPNFMKIAPIIEAIRIAQEDGFNLQYRLIHTGQHYDKKMSEDFFHQLSIPEPDINLGVGSGSQAEQTGRIMLGYEKVIETNKPDFCLVVGDVTSTMACSITAKKSLIKVGHVEAGIRSGDLSMPEEINRIVTDSITDYFFTTSEFANNNLRRMGIDEANIFFVGNTMIDTLLKEENNFKQPIIWNEAKLDLNNFIVMTLHRPTNVDDGQKLRDLINEILYYSRKLPIIFPVHPRTNKILINLGIRNPSLFAIEPLSYLEFNYLVKNAKAVITDSGGITEETTVLGIPCITLRDSTERPETCIIGTNELIGTDLTLIQSTLSKLFDGKWKRGSIPPLWDGKASKRIISQIIQLYDL
jgi:UDP-N-acetylglucosamine 2-epimerase (non-hydrolysing)